MGGPVVIGGDNLPSPVGIGLTDLPNIGGASGPPGPPGSGTTESRTTEMLLESIVRAKITIMLKVKNFSKSSLETLNKFGTLARVPAQS